MPDAIGRLLPLVASFLALSLLPAGRSTSGQQAAASDLPLALTAFAVDFSGIGRARAGTIDITIERWSTDAERDRLRDILVEKGSDELLEAIQRIKPRAGFIRTSRRIGWDIYYARETTLASGGRRIVFATDRPMSFWELRNRPRSRDYEFMLCEIRLGPDGKGQGKLATAARISYNRGEQTIEIENYGIEPVRLQQVTVVRGKKKQE